MIKRKEIALIILQTLFLVSVTLFAVIPFSCKVTTEGIEIIGGDYTSPCIDAVTVVDERTVTMDFSDAVELKVAVVSPVIEGISDSEKHSATEKLSPSLAAACGEYGKIETKVVSSEDGKSVTLYFGESTVIGKTYEVYGTVEDRIGNTLTFCVPFTGFNSELPKVIMTEVQVKYGKGTLKGETVYRGEYVECLALEDGNLAGLEIVSAADGELKAYEFPAIEVTKGEVFLVHFRTIGEGCINETGEDLNLAFAAHSKDGVRDLWSESTSSHFNDSSDVIVLRDKTSGTIVDAVMYAAADADGWKPDVGEMAEAVAECGIYVTGDICNASCSKGVSPLKSLTRVDAAVLAEALSRDEDIELPVESDESSWSVMAATPGVL